ncbi:MAG TPA: POTRA domain-containing protein [Thermoanaerobaculia bacterium]|nr:POTRA domain-containing protein [Thermoanaerobaculia bacterium]
MRLGARRGATWLAAVLLLPGLARAQEPLRIGKISVRVVEIFTPEEAVRGWFYRAANAIHIGTREAVIRKFLLFREGDPYDPARLDETERNLRSLGFLTLASVTAGPPHDGIVDVDVATHDAWTLQPSLSLGSKGGVSTYSLKLEESNLAGSGRQVSVAYDKETERTNRLLQYQDPYLLGPYWAGDFLYSQNSDGEEQRAQIKRPFSSFVDPQSATFLAHHLTEDDRLFTNGEESARFRQSHREFEAEYGWAVAASDERARRLTVGFDALDDRFSALAQTPGGVLPEDRSFRTVFLQYEDVRNDFLKLNYVNRDVRYEDFSIGRRLLARVGLSPALFGLDRTTWLARFEAARGWRLGPESFLTVSLDYETRWQGRAENEILSVGLLYVHKFDARMPQTLVSRLMIDRGWRLDGERQFFADGSTGLRGYHLHAFEGDRRLIWNVEQRIFSGKEILQLVSPGLAVFFDTGVAAPPGQPLGLARLRNDVGAGLRFAISRAATNNILRIDFAYALDPDPRGRKGWLVSFSSGQEF